jgi:toxin-antitoxin system PIN domain toxin
MTILDANVLLHAYNVDSPHHAVAARWLAELFASDETVAIPLLTIWAFIRVATNPRLSPQPLAANQAFGFVERWLDQPGIVVLQPGPRHLEILKRLTLEYGVSGQLVTDAVLAALALENGAALASTDQDFRRFPELRWINPLRELR